MKRLRNIIVLILASFMVSSCLLATLASMDDNSSLYGTEWSTEDTTEGLKFYKGDRVLFYCSNTYGTYTAEGSFLYYSSSSTMSFEGLTINYGSYIVDITNAFILDDGSMKLIWHKVGEEENYYEILFQRR